MPEADIAPQAFYRPCLDVNADFKTLRDKRDSRTTHAGDLIERVRHCKKCVIRSVDNPPLPLIEPFRAAIDTKHAQVQRTT